jgi:hypothetical protein
MYEEIFDQLLRRPKPANSSRSTTVDVNLAWQLRSRDYCAGDGLNWQLCNVQRVPTMGLPTLVMISEVKVSR